MALVCAAESCKAHHFIEENCNLVFFPFPDDEETCRAWVLRSGRHDMLGRTVEEIHLTEFLCERHFEEHALDRRMDMNGRIALRPKAKPSHFEHDISQYAEEITQEKAIGNDCINPDIVVIPCVIMEGVNTEVIDFEGASENVEENINKNTVTHQIQLIQEQEYLSGPNVLPQSSKSVEQQVVTSIQDRIEDPSMLSSQSLVLEGVNIESETEWSDASLAILANQICRICAHQNDNLLPIFEEQSIQLHVLDKIQWHLPIVVREDDKLPLKICRRCIARLDSWHDMISSCVEADSKLRKMFKLDEEFDASAAVYCDLNSTSPSAALEQNQSSVPAMEALGEGTLIEQHEQNAVSLEITLQTQKHEECVELKLPEGQRPVAEQILPVEEAEIKSESPEGLFVTHSPELLLNGAMESESQVAMDAQSQAGLPAVPALPTLPVDEVELPAFEKQTQEEQTMPGPFEVNTIKEEELEAEAEMEEEERAGEGAEMEGFRCTWCPHVTRRKKSLEQHMARRHMPPPAICSYCDKTFSSEEAMHVHERIHIKDASCFECKACERTFRSKKTLKEHNIAMHSEEKPYQCDKCDKNYGSLSSLDIHRATHSSETPYLCDLCGKTFKHVSNLRSHKRSHLADSDKNRQICYKCHKGFRSRFHLSEHMNVHNDTRPYVCERCGKRFHKKIQLRQHGSAHSGTQPYKCPVCGVKFNRRGNMTQHVKRHGQERKYTCRVCGESFPTLGAVLNHRKKHSEAEVERSAATHATTVGGDDPDQVAYKCDVCGKLLAKKESLSIHMRSHTGEKLFQCPECGKRLSNKGSLTYHMRSFHTGERPHRCQFCGDGFLSREACLVHERIHTGEKPYQCLVCGMAFRCSSNLAQHSRVHSDARPHICQHCGKCFQRKGALDVHMRTHTGERPFPCDMCGRAFTQKNDMLKHRRTHTLEKPFTCEDCGQSFAQKRDLTKHRLAHTQISVDPLAVVEPLATVEPLAAVEPLTAVEPAAATVTVTRQEDLPPQTVVITTSDSLLSAFPEMNVQGIEHAQTVILHTF